MHTIHTHTYTYIHIHAGYGALDSCIWVEGHTYIHTQTPSYTCMQVTERLIAAYGWRGALKFLAAGTGILNMASSLTFISPSNYKGTKPDSKVCVCVYIYIYTHTQTHYIYIYIYIYTHTHTLHKYTRRATQPIHSHSRGKDHRIRHTKGTQNLCWTMMHVP